LYVYFQTANDNGQKIYSILYSYKTFEMK
jgi:hypothetical protein